MAVAAAPLTWKRWEGVVVGVAAVVPGPDGVPARAPGVAPPGAPGAGLASGPISGGPEGTGAGPGSAPGVAVGVIGAAPFPVNWMRSIERPFMPSSRLTFVAVLSGQPAPVSVKFCTDTRLAAPGA